MRFINLTPRDVRVVSSDGSVISFLTEGLATCGEKRETIGEIFAFGMHIPITEVILGDIIGLPEPVSDTYYIVSLTVARCAAQDGRTSDILVPDRPVRDKKGKVVGYLALSRQPQQ